MRGVALGEAPHGAVFLGAAHAAVNEFDNAAKPLRQIAVPVLGGGDVDHFGLFDQRTDPVDAAAGIERALDRIDHFGKPLERQRAGIDFLPAGRLLAQFRDIHVAEIGQHQRARDGRRRQHQKIDRLALTRECQPLMHAETVLLVDNGEREIVEGDVLLKQRVRADDKVDVAGGERRKNFGPLAAALAAGENGDADAGGVRQRLYGGQVLPRQNFRRRHQRRLPAGFDDGRRGKQRHHRLAGADVTVKKPQHAVRLRQVRDDVGDRALLRGRQRVGERLDDTRAQLAFRRSAAARARPHAPAQQRERKLAGEQFVVGETCPGGVVRIEVGRLVRPVDAAQRVGEIRKAVALEPGGVLPFRQIRQALERALDRFVYLGGVEALGKRIDRIEQRQLQQALLVDDAVGMHHLQVPVVERRRPGHVTGFADRQELLQIILAGVEIRQRQRVGVVVGVDVVGRARPVRRGRAVFVDHHLDRHHRVRRNLGEFRPVAPVDVTGRQMEQKIDHPRRLVFAPEEPGIELLELRADA